MCGVACVVGLAMIKPVLGRGCGCGLEREASGDWRLERAEPRSRTLLCSVHCACLAPDPVRTRDSRPDPDAGAARCRCRCRSQAQVQCSHLHSIPCHVSHTQTHPGAETLAWSCLHQVHQTALCDAQSLAAVVHNRLFPTYSTWPPLAPRSRSDQTRPDLS